MKKKYLFEVGGENLEVGKFEAKYVLECENYKPLIIFEESNVVIFNVSKDIKIDTVRRLGMTKRVSKVIHLFDKSDDIDGTLDYIEKIDIEKKSFAIRVIGKRNVSEKEIAIKIGEKIAKENEINLSEPEIKILFFAGTKIVISINETIMETSYKRCLNHHIKYRPYFSPISIHPRIARAMVNMAKCKVNDKLIDPFCGTGGILIEAADIGIKIIGLDILDKMVENTKGYLKHFGLEGEIKTNDVKKISNFKFDAIVCDPPYGISTTTKGEDVTRLMQRTMRIFAKNLSKGKRVIMAVSNLELIETEGFLLKNTFEWYVHKSLTRNLLVLEKI